MINQNEMSTRDKFDFILRVAKEKSIDEGVIYDALIERFKEHIETSRKARNEEDARHLLKQYWAKSINELYSVFVNKREEK